jgi:5-oxopent-3-ene-1,2,5-tricarboxylate decarboxylase/2-hydroxyhepta-2,4-diene-1,7-dioate isomerase
LKLFSFLNKNNLTSVGVETDQGTYDLTRAFDIYQQAKRVHQPISFAFLQVMVEMGYCSTSAVNKIFSDPWVQSKAKDLSIETGIPFDVPIARPSKIICLGRNYSAHARELKHAIPKEPVLFAKASSALVPHEKDIVIPYWLDSRVDHEAELAVVIGKTARYISRDVALDYIAGYTIVNDVTARTVQKEDMDRSDPWFRSKSIDTFCPMGPYLVPVEDIPDPQNLDIALTVNGQERQHANTSSMLFPVTELMETISKYMTLQPGDIIATGTPEGVSPIKDGDVVEITIEKLGTLRNTVRKEKPISEPAT